MTKDDMRRVTEDFVSAARTAKECGFDAIELHVGHGYLLSQFISPFYNKRRDEYGGSIDKRMEFPREVLSRILEEVGNELAVVIKFSMTDGRSGGNTINEGIEIAKIIERTGGFGINISSFLVQQVITLGTSLRLTVLRAGFGG